MSGIKTASDAMSFDEIASRLRTLALDELCAINQLEFFAAKAASSGEGGGSDLTTLTVQHIRRQAHAIGLAHRIALALARQPAKARGLGLNCEEFTDLVALDGEYSA